LISLPTLGIDPGVRRSACVLLAPNGLILDSAWHSCPRELLLWLDGRSRHAVVEGQQHYPGVASSQPNDLIALALEAGRLAGALGSVGVSVKIPKPREWKGTVPKPIHNARVSKKLTGRFDGVSEEQANHFIDAAGLALWGVTEFVE